jgi:hypothetical protein
MITDDAAVAGQRILHLELFGQYARLPASLRPATAQGGLVLTLGYGAARNLELGFDFPLIAIARTGRTAVGTGDLNLTGKLLLRAPSDSTAWRFGVAAAVELPTGKSSSGFGSGVVDVNLNLIAENRPLAAATVRFNAGIQFAGNTLTGLIGIRDRGVVLSGGGSVAWSLLPSLAVAAELSGYQGRSRIEQDHELRAQGAVTLALGPSSAVAISLQHGWYASPGWTLQLGTALDW